MLFLSGPRPDNLYPRAARFRALLQPCIFAAILAAAPGYAQHAVPLTLAEAEQLALVAEPGEQALHFRAAAFDERASVAGQLPDPVLRIGLNNFPIESGGFSTEGMTHVAVGIRQSFPAGKTRTLSTRRLDAFAADMTGQAKSRARDVLIAARIAWLDLYYWNKAYALVSESRPLFDDLVTVTRSLYTVGRKSQQDLLRAELELSRLDDRLIDIDRQRARATASLAEWIGEAARRPIAAKLPAWDSVPDLSIMRERLASHPALLAADARIAASSAGVELAEQRSKPGWALDVGYSYREGMLATGEPRSDFISLGVTVDLPFLRRTSVDKTLSAALQERSAIAADRERLWRALQSELEIEYVRWRDLSRRQSLYEDRILGQASDHAQASLLAYQSDKGDFADVMRGHIDDLNTRIDYFRLQIERAQSYAVLAGLGGLIQ